MRRGHDRGHGTSNAFICVHRCSSASKGFWLLFVAAQEAVHFSDRALVRSPALRRMPGSGSSAKRRVISLRIEVVSYDVWSTKPRFANGETMIVGTREPGPQRSPQPSPLGGGTWSQ